MERFRLKNIIILILALLNFCLLVSLLTRSTARQEGIQQTNLQLAELFQTEGIHLTLDTIPDDPPLPAYAVGRSPQQNRDLIARFLGEAVSVTEQTGGDFTYGSNAGAASCSLSGTFDIIGTEITTDSESFCKKFCREYHYKDLILDLDAQDSGTATATQYFEDAPVFNCTVTFTIRDDGITRISGTYLPQGKREPLGHEALSASAALLSFLDLQKENGALISEITEMYPCYELESTVSSLNLTPAWCIMTDVSAYYVNCHSGAVTHS